MLKRINRAEWAQLSEGDIIFDRNGEMLMVRAVSSNHTLITCQETGTYNDDDMSVEFDGAWRVNLTYGDGLQIEIAL